MKLGISDTKLNMLVSTSDHFSIGTFRVKGLSDLIISEDLGIFYTTSVTPHQLVEIRCQQKQPLDSIIRILHSTASHNPSLVQLYSLYVGRLSIAPKQG
jgi:hypothetical protein